MTTIRSPHRRTPAAARRRAGRRVLALVLLLAGAAGAARAQTGWTRSGGLASSDLRWHRPYFAGAQCLLSSIGTNVYYDVHEVFLDDPVAPADLTASLCTGTSFDTVLYFYQRASGAPGGFDPEAPCTRLQRYNDDFCGAQSRIAELGLVRGFVTVVVTSFANGVTGPYQLTASSQGSALGRFIFYGGFETGNARTWSRRVL